VEEVVCWINVFLGLQKKRHLNMSEQNTTRQTQQTQQTQQRLLSALWKGFVTYVRSKVLPNSC